MGSFSLSPSSYYYYHCYFRCINKKNSLWPIFHVRSDSAGQETEKQQKYFQNRC